MQPLSDSHIFQSVNVEGGAIKLQIAETHLALYHSSEKQSRCLKNLRVLR